MTLARIHVRIYPAAEEIIKIRIERFPIQNSAAELIPGKSGEMADVKNEWMPPNDGPREQNGIFHQPEDFIAPGPGGNKAFLPPPTLAESRYRRAVHCNSGA
jgi:hypothetical protein